MARKPENKKNLTVMIRPEARAALEQLAAKKRMSLGEVVEHLVLEARADPADYFRRQTALQGFLTAGLVTAMAKKVLGHEEASAFREVAAEMAAELFGPPPVRPFETAAVVTDPDPRVLALFAAFGVD